MKPEDPRAEQSPSSVAGDTAPHPVSVSLWESFLSRENFTEALRRVEQNAGAPGHRRDEHEGAAAVVA